MHCKEVWNPNRITQPMQRMPLLRNKPPSILAPLHASCPPSNFHSQTQLVHKWSNCIWLHFAYLSSWVINPFGEWQASARYFGVSMRSSVSDRASVVRPSRRSSCNSNVLQRSHTRVLTHIHSLGVGPGKRAHGRGGKSDSCGCEHSAAYRTSARAHTHNLFFYCAREIISGHAYLY